MQTIPQPPGGDNPICPPIDAYAETSWRQLKSAIANAETHWLYLDKHTRERLEESGLDKEDLREAINIGVARGELERKVVDGERAIRLLAKKEAQR